MSDFVPKTEMERIFVQTVGWDALRLWRRLISNAERENWSHVAAMTLSLTFVYLQQSATPTFSAHRRSRLEEDALGTIEYMDTVLGKLSMEEQHSYFRLSHLALTLLAETDATFHNAPVSCILHFMHEVFVQESRPKSDQLEQALLLQRLYACESWREQFLNEELPVCIKVTETKKFELPDLELEKAERTRQARIESPPNVPMPCYEFIPELGIYVEVFGDKFVFETDARLKHHESWRLRIVKIHEDGEAHRSGWRVGDVILSVNSFPITSIDELRTSYSNLLPGEVVAVKIKRNNEIKSYRVSLKKTSSMRQHKRADSNRRHELITAGHSRQFESLNSKLDECTTRYGINSDQATHALVSLASFVGRTRIFGVNIYLYELVGILENHEIFVSAFDLRRVYYLSRDIQAEPGLLDLSRKLQTLVFERRIADFGRDMGMAIPLARLVRIWSTTNRLKDGSDLCKSLQEWARISLPADDLIFRQIESAASFVKQLQMRSITAAEVELPRQQVSDNETVGEGSMSLASVKESVVEPVVEPDDEWKETDEFISMMALVALDHKYNQREQQSDQVLQELLAYYAECEGEDARRVGEMLWALMETDLRESKSFREGLIELSMRRAINRHRRIRLYAHVKRLVYLQRAKDKVDATLRFIWEDCRSISPSFATLVYEQFLHFAVKDRKQYVTPTSSKDELEAAELEFLNIFSPNRPLSQASLQFGNELGEQLSECFISAKRPAEAIDILRTLLAQPRQTRENVTLLLTRLAHAHVADGNVFEATAVLYLAFNIPDADDYFDPESEPEVLESA